jgi:hypothetical protein
MEVLKKHTNPNCSRKRNTPLENSRVAILYVGYRLIELKSTFKKKIRYSYQHAKDSGNYKNITLSAVEGQRGKKSF